MTGLIEGLVDVIASWRRVGSQELIYSGPVPQSGRLPQAADARAVGDKQPGHMPAPIADSIGQRRADRPAGNLDIRAAIDQGSGHVDVIAAGRPVQRRLVAPGGMAEARVCPDLDQQVHDFRTVGEITRPVGDQVQQGPEAAFAVH